MLADALAWVKHRNNKSACFAGYFSGQAKNPEKSTF
jgi:hypothetical protein